MFKVKLKDDLSKAPFRVKNRNKKGDIIDIPDRVLIGGLVGGIAGWCEILEHYKLVPKYRICKHCNSKIKERVKVMYHKCDNVYCKCTSEKHNI